ASCAWDRACARVAHPGLSEGLTASPDAVELLPGFDAPRFVQIPWRERITRAGYVARWLTVSSFLAASEVERARMVAEVERILDTDPETAGHDEFELPQLADVYVYRASAGPRTGSRQGVQRSSAEYRVQSSSGAQSTPRNERSVSTIGPSFVTATVCSECDPRDPSALRSVQPSASVLSSSVVARNQGSRANTSPSRRGNPRPARPSLGTCGSPCMTRPTPCPPKSVLIE